MPFLQHACLPPARVFIFKCSFFKLCLSDFLQLKQVGKANKERQQAKGGGRLTQSCGVEERAMKEGRVGWAKKRGVGWETLANRQFSFERQNAERVVPFRLDCTWPLQHPRLHIEPAKVWTKPGFRDAPNRRLPRPTKTLEDATYDACNEQRFERVHRRSRAAMRIPWNCMKTQQIQFNQISFQTLTVGKWMR